MVALETVFGDFCRGSGCRVAQPRQNRRHFTLTALMLISAWAMSASSGQNRLAKSGGYATGNDGDFRADGVTLFFSARISSS